MADTNGKPATVPWPPCNEHIQVWIMLVKSKLTSEKLSLSAMLPASKPCLSRENGAHCHVASQLHAGVAAPNLAPNQVAPVGDLSCKAGRSVISYLAHMQSALPLDHELAFKKHMLIDSCMHDIL